MRIAVSGIAWDVDEDPLVADLLRRSGIDAVDIAPGKYFARPEKVTHADVRRVRTWWEERGIEITGMQALLFGTAGLNLFGDEPRRAAMLAYLSTMCRIGGMLGGTRLVFGSPRQRERAGLTDAACLNIASEFFRALGERAAEAGVTICLEPVPTAYGANFMTNSTETAAVVLAVDHPSIRMQLDTGSLHANGENPLTVLAACAPLVGHVHISEPGLVPLGDGGVDHASAAAALRRYLPDSVVSIEMVATSQEPHLQSIARAVHVAVSHYAASVHP
jgi:D-psicose/D-tagatose/L-ribulose 3-epimerase